MPVRIVKTEPRCKVCRHARRDEIDALLEQRSLGREDADGKRINLDYVLAKLKEWDFENPTPENVKNHWQKHCELVNEEEVAADAAALEAAIEKLGMEDIERLDVEGVLKRIAALGMASVEEKIAQGRPSGITVDHVLKSIDSLTRRGVSDAQRDLLNAIGGGVAQALGQAFKPKELEEPILEAEVVEVKS